MEDEIRCLIPGGLYASCGVVRVKLPAAPSSAPDSSSGKEKKGKAVPGEGGRAEEDDPRDVLGREVWEMMEHEVREWDAAEKQKTAESFS